MRTVLMAMMLLAGVTTTASAQTAPFEERLGEALFTALERELIGEYFRNHPMPKPERASGDDGGSKADNGKKADKGSKSGGKSKQAPPGLAKRSELPPGLARRDVLPPGLQGRGLPTDLEARLPTRQKGQQRVVVDTDVLLIETATGLILDIIRGAGGL